jgi:eukaryotic-like serine/threonine-protein kinase
MDPANRRVGSILDGKWTLESLLGVGGMAAVYAATHRNGARAAIKLFPFSVTTSPEFAERILREGYLANKIGHPSVVRVLDDHLDREREYAYLVMELLEGETARERIERLGPMTPLEAVNYAIELCECLKAAHEKGVVHRDIKPENLFLTTEDRLKVLDFGVARALDGSSSTRTGSMLGTPAYMSPEQARGRPSEISPRSDLYSAGATLLFLLSGDFLHDGESAQEIMVRAAWTPAPKVADRGLGIPDVVAAIIDKACHFEAKDRYESAARLKAALEAARDVLAITSPPAIAAVRRTSPQSSSSISLSPISRPSSDAVETMFDKSSPTTDSAAVRTAATFAKRRMRRYVTIGMALVAVSGVVGLYWVQSQKPADITAASSPRVQSEPPHVAAPVQAPPPAPTVELPQATAPEPEPKAELPAAEPATSQAKARQPGVARRPKPVSPPETAQKPVTAAAPPAAPKAAPAASAGRPSMGRDVGY